MIKAAGSRIVVKPIEEAVDDKSKGMNILILPKKNDQIRAQVIAIGSEIDENIELHDLVYLLSGSGVEVEINGELYLSVVENQILAAWRDE